MQVHSGGLLRATPHFVKGVSGPHADGIARNTLAIFMQPRQEITPFQLQLEVQA